MSDREPLEMLSQLLDDDVGERNGAVGGRRLRWAEERWSSGEEDELLIDPEGAFVEIDVVDVEAEALALPQAGAGSEDDQRPVAGRHSVGECVDDARR